MSARSIKKLGFVVVTLAAALAFSGILPVGDVPVDGTKMRLSDTLGPGGRRNAIVLRAGDPSGVFPDPRLTGATAYIGRVGVGEITTIPLPAAGWSGGTGAKQDYKFKSRTGTVISARLRAGGSLRFSARGDGAYPLGGIVQNDVGIILDVAGVRFCSLFGGTKQRDDGTRFRARLAPAPAACPLLGAPTTTTLAASTTSSSSSSSTTSTGPADTSTTSTTSTPASTTSTTGVPQCNSTLCRLCQLGCRSDETFCKLSCLDQNFNCRSACVVQGTGDPNFDVPACQTACDVTLTACNATCDSCEPDCATDNGCGPDCR
jgi:hypothetical protein